MIVNSPTGPEDAGKYSEMTRQRDRKTARSKDSEIGSQSD